MTNNTSYFWFFAPDNVEVVIKLLDGCEIDPFHTFWVFAAGLTDVEVRLQVTDTESGEIQEYVNPRGERSSRPRTPAPSRPVRSRKSVDPIRPRINPP